VRVAVEGDMAVRRSPLRNEGTMLHNDLRYRAVIPMVAGVLITIVVALIWRWIS